MEMRELMQVYKLIEQHEGYRQFPYADTKGIATVGIGRNLQTRGIAKTEADLMLINDVEDAQKYLNNYAFFAKLNGPRQAALIDMVFNLGSIKFGGFTTFISLLEHGNFMAAAIDLRKSLWVKEVGGRAIRDALMIETGEWPR